jgi:hypothetical protein
VAAGDVNGGSYRSRGLFIHEATRFAAACGAHHHEVWRRSSCPTLPEVETLLAG